MGIAAERILEHNPPSPPTLICSSTQLNFRGVADAIYTSSPQ